MSSRRSGSPWCGIGVPFEALFATQRIWPARATHTAIIWRVVEGVARVDSDVDAQSGHGLPGGVRDRFGPVADTKLGQHVADVV